MVIPGAGEANFDTFEVNVFENKKQKREAIIHSLLDKVSFIFYFFLNIHICLIKSNCFQ